MSNSFATPWTVVHQDPPSMGFPRQEYWSGFSFPSPGDLPDPRTEPVITWLSCTPHVVPHGMITKLPYTGHVTDHAQIT